MTRFQNPCSRAVIVAITLCAVLAIPAMALAQPGTTQRPISDFTSRQGTYCAANPAKCTTFLSTYIAWTQPSLNRIAIVDLAAKENVPGITTTTSGTITERPLPDGRAEVRVRLDTRNALAFVYTFEDAPGDCGEIAAKDPLFGRRPSEAGAKAVAASSLDFTFVNTAPGAPLPDLIGYVACDPTADITAVKQVSFTANGTGPLRATSGLGEGTGRLQITQQGLFGAAFTNGFKGGLGDGFPVEHINLRAVGN